MKTLHFTFRGQPYMVNEQGHINANGIGHFSPSWVFVGGSKHHMNQRPTVYLQHAFQFPEHLSGCYGWDLDHGTLRTWGGQWAGRIPRIENAYVTVQPNA